MEADDGGDADNNGTEGFNVQMSQAVDQYQMTISKCFTCGEVGHYSCKCPEQATLGKMKVLNTSGSSSKKGHRGSLILKSLSLRSN